MRLSHAGKWIYFANPKCGSQSIRAMLDPHSEPALALDQNPPGALPMHVRPHHMRAMFAQLGLPWDLYFRFTTVRNPWSKLVSLYEYERSATLRLPAAVSFAHWLVSPEYTLPPEHRALRASCYPLSYFAGDDAGGLLVDVVVRLEHLSTELPPVLARMGLPPSLAIRHVNATPHRPYADYYDATTRKVVELMYGDEIERFGYRFGE